MASSYSTPPPAYSAAPGSSSSSALGKQPKPNHKIPNTDPTTSGSTAHSDMFPPGHWRDLWAALLFYLHLAAVGGFAAYSISYLRKHPLDVPTDPLVGHQDVNLMTPVLAVLGSCLSSALIGMAVLGVTKRAPETAIKGAFMANIVLGFVLFAMIAASGAGWASVFALLMAGLSVVMYFMYRRHIPLSAAILKAVIEVLAEYPAMLNVSFMSVVAQVAYFVVFGVCVVGLGQMSERMKQEAVAAVSVALVFSLFWTSQVIQNVALTTIAGVYATVYYMTAQRPANPTAKSFQRAVTWSFGSICFGSLVVAVLQTIRYLVNKDRRGNDLAGAIMDCLLRIVEDLTKYFNYYAFIHVAIYGKPYIQSGKAVWSLLKRNGVLSIINDSIIGTFCGMASLAISTLCAIVTYLVLWLFVTDTTTAIVSAYVSLLLGSLTCYLVFEVIQSGATTTMVCLAEDPNAVNRCKPELYNKLSASYASIFYNWRYP